MSNKRPTPSNPLKMAHIGLEFALAAFVLGAAGWWVDGKLGTKPWGMAIGGTVGLVGGFYLFLKEALAANREANQDAGELRHAHRSQAQADEAAKPPPEALVDPLATDPLARDSLAKDPLAQDPFKNPSHP